MSNEWKQRFQDRISDLDDSLGQSKKVTTQDFALYKRHVLELYERVVEKVSDIPQIEVTRPIITRSDASRVDVQGVIETVHALVLRFHDKHLEFHPEGLNFGRSRGRVRLRHNGKGMSRFLYASLETGRDTAEPVWYLLDREKPAVGEDAGSERSRPLSSAVIEELLECVFLTN